MLAHVQALARKGWLTKAVQGHLATGGAPQPTPPPKDPTPQDLEELELSDDEDNTGSKQSISGNTPPAVDEPDDELANASSSVADGRVKPPTGLAAPRAVTNKQMTPTT